MIDPLATSDDYEARYGETSAEELDQRLADASAAVRAYTGQQFTQGETTKVLRVVAGKVRLPHRPVVSVDALSAVNYDGTRTVITGFGWDGLNQVSVPPQGFVLNLPAFDQSPLETVEVTWTHGYDEIPEEIVAIVCAAANRALTATASGLVSETIGSYSYRTADGASDAPISFTDGERAILNRYRARAAALQT